MVYFVNIVHSYCQFHCHWLYSLYRLAVGKRKDTAKSFPTSENASVAIKYREFEKPFWYNA